MGNERTPKQAARARWETPGAAPSDLLWQLSWVASLCSKPQHGHLDSAGMDPPGNVSPANPLL